MASKIPRFPNSNNKPDHPKENRDKSSTLLNFFKEEAYRQIPLQEMVEELKNHDFKVEIKPPVIWKMAKKVLGVLKK